MKLAKFDNNKCKEQHLGAAPAHFQWGAIDKSTLIVPSRLYPYYLLVKLYDETGEAEKVLQTAAIVQTKEAKVHSTAVKEMREEVKKSCEKYRTN